MKYIVAIGIVGILSLAGCKPKKGTIEDKEAIKKDSIDPREGEGEGEVGNSVYGQ